MIFQSDSFWDEVDPFSSAVSETVIPIDVTWEVRRFYGAAAFVDNVEVRLVWDYGGTEEIVVNTHGDIDVRIDKQVTGDGAKKLAIVLINDTAATHAIGAMWEARVL